jgi:hypothetical protein
MIDGRHPIVLAQGIARFDFLLNHLVNNLGALGFNLDPVLDGLHYYKGIATHLRKHGFDVHHTTVSFAAGVEQRAADLRDQTRSGLINSTSAES